MDIQLEFNFSNESCTDRRLSEMQLQIDAIKESTDKVRKKLFSEMNELKKSILYLKGENIELKEKLKDLLGEKAEWQYLSNENLFEMPEKKSVI